MKPNAFLISLCTFVFAVKAIAGPLDAPLAPEDIKVDSVELICEQTSGFTAKNALGNALSSPVPAGTTPGAGLAGLVIGGLIGNAIINADVKRKNMAPIKPIVDALDLDRLQNDLSTHLTEAVLTTLGAHAEWKDDFVSLQLLPRLAFDPMAARLSLRVDVRGRASDGSKTSERYETTTVSREGDHNMHVQYWTDNQMHNFYEQVDVLTQEVMRLMSHYHHEIQSHPKNHRAVRYSDDFGTFYERGTILSNVDGKIEYLSMAGVVKSVYGVLEE